MKAFKTYAYCKSLIENHILTAGYSNAFSSHNYRKRQNRLQNMLSPLLESANELKVFFSGFFCGIPKLAKPIVQKLVLSQHS